MINALRRRFFTLRYNYVNPTMRQRAQGLILMIWAAIAFIMLFIAVRVGAGAAEYRQRAGDRPAGTGDRRAGAAGRPTG